MRNRKGALVAAGILCAAAATTALWSGPLAAVSDALHTGGAVQAPASPHVHLATGSHLGR